MVTPLWFSTLHSLLYYALLLVIFAAFNDSVQLIVDCGGNEVNITVHVSTVPPLSSGNNSLCFNQNGSIVSTVSHCIQKFREWKGKGDSKVVVCAGSSINILMTRV